MCLKSLCYIQLKIGKEFGYIWVKYFKIHEKSSLGDHQWKVESKWSLSPRRSADMAIYLFFNRKVAADPTLIILEGKIDRYRPPDMD